MSYSVKARNDGQRERARVALERVGVSTHTALNVTGFLAAKWSRRLADELEAARLKPVEGRPLPEIVE